MEQPNDPSELERRVAALESRLARLEGSATVPARPGPQPPIPRPAPVVPRVPPQPSDPAARERTFGRIIAWAGGLAFTTGIVLLVSLAVEQGWIGPGVRFGLGLALALAATALSVYLSTGRRLFRGLAEDPTTRLSVARSLFVAGLAGGYAASYAGFARWDLFGFSTLSALVAVVTLLHLVLGHLSGDIVRAGSAIAAAFLVPIYAEDLASVRVEAWPAVILFTGAALLSVVWSRRSGSVTAWILGTVGVSALFVAAEANADGARTFGIWVLAAASGATVWMIGTRLAGEDDDFSPLDAVLVGWLALSASGFLTSWAFSAPEFLAEVAVVVTLGSSGFLAHRARWGEVADGLTVAAIVLAFMSLEEFSDPGLLSMASGAAILVVATVWWADRLGLAISRFATRGIAVVVGVVAATLLAVPILDDRTEVVLSGGLVMLALAVAAFLDRESLGRWVFGPTAAVVWVAWWAALSGLTFEPDAITTAGWFTTAIAAMYVGRRWRLRAAPIAGLVLGGVSYLKLFLYDLSAVEPALRIVLFLVVGAALVGFAYRSSTGGESRS